MKKARYSNDELIKINAAQQDLINRQAQQIAMLKYELEQLKKLIVGPRSERFIPSQDGQSTLFDQETTVNEVDSSDAPEDFTVVKKKKTGKQPKRSKMPSHLPVEQIILEPEIDTTGMEKIGQYESWKYTVTPPEIKIIETVRPKYKDADGQIHIAELNEAFPKTNFDAAFVAYMIVQKFLDHLPIYRQMKIFDRHGLSFSRSTLNSGVMRGAAKLKLLYALLKTKALQSNYLQADESSIPVLTKDKPGSTLKGCMLVKLAPKENVVVFDYIKTKEKINILSALDQFSGHLQVDGNVSYESKGRQADVTLMHCLIHSRRKFIEAQDYDEPKASQVLKQIAEIYRIERQCKKEGLNPEQIRQRRQDLAVPIFEQIKTWLENHHQPNLPSNPLQKAINYMLKRWNGLVKYTTDGNLLPDNNLIENQIRPLALGRKNFMFCGSHSGANMAATLYSFLGTCKLNDINSFHWLVHVFNHIDDHDINKLHQLLPLQQNRNRFQ